MSETLLVAKPLFLIAPGSMSPRDIRRAEKQCRICIAECKAADAVRLLEPPILANIDAQARAALELFRHVRTYGDGSTETTFRRGYLVKWFVDALMTERPQTVVAVKKVKA